MRLSRLLLYVQRFFRPRSLKWQLVWRLVVLQVVLLTVMIVILLAGLTIAGVIPDNYEGRAIDVLRKTVRKDDAGKLTLKEGPLLAGLRAEVPNLWFIVRDTEGNKISEGEVPRLLTDIPAALDYISDATFVKQFGGTQTSATVQWADTAAGRVQIFTGAQGEFHFMALVSVTPELFTDVILPVGGVMGLATLIVIPLVVRNAFKGMRRAAALAERIDVEERGVRLPLESIPTEISPLVRAVNGALDRLDKGYERHKRFLVDAAHELRTPVAILNTRITSLPPTPERARLLQDTARLSNLTDQLLDIQRLGRQSETLTNVELIAVARGVVFDLAPLAFAAGYEMSFEPVPGKVVVNGDQTAIERAITNLVQNAIEHGGNSGRITVKVTRAAMIEVADEGDGVPVAERETIFEPFYRLRQRGHGAGLGLNLVQEIMQMHGGRIELACTEDKKGACFRLVFPKAHA